MALNFMGLGFTFGGKDLGLSKLQESVASGFEKMSRVFDVAQQASTGISMAMDDLAEKVAAAPRPVEGALGGFASFLKSVAHNVETNNTAIDRSLKGLKGKIGGLLGPLRGSFDGVGKVASGMADKLKGSFGVLAKSGKNLGGAIGERFKSIKDKFGEVGGAAGAVAKAVTTRFPVIGRSVEGVRVGAVALGVGFKGAANTAITAMRGMKAGASRIGGVFKTTYGMARDTLKGIGDGFASMGRAITSVSHLIRQNTFGAFFDVLRTGHTTVEQTAQHIEHLATENRNLTTGLEATMQANATSARRMGANYGLVGRELSRFTSRASGMALGMNISVDTAAAATMNWTTQMSNLRRVGLRSAADLARLQEVTGTSSQVLTDSIRQMHDEFGLSDRAMNALTSSTVAAGRSMRNIGGQMQNIPALLAHMRQQSAATGNELHDMDLASFAVQTNALAAAFHRAGSTFDDANTQAMGIADTLIQSQRNIQHMFGGTETEMSQFAQGMGVATGDISNAFRFMQQGPAGMVQGLTEMVHAAQHSGRGTRAAMGFLQSQLEQSLGPEQANRLMSFFNTANQGTIDLMHSVTASRAPLRQVGTEGFRTGRTLAESFDLAEQSFVSSFRSFGRGGQFVASTTHEFSRFNHRMHDIVRRGGPMARLIQQMATIHQVGTLGLIPETLRPMAAVLGTVASAAMPTIQALGSLGLRFGMLMNPIGLIVAAVGGLIYWFRLLRLSGMSTEDSVRTMGHTIAHGIRALPGIFRRVVARAVELFHSFSTLASQLAPEVLHSLREMGHTIGGLDLGRYLRPALDAVVSAFSHLGALLGRVNWRAVFGVLVVGVRNTMVRMMSTLGPLALQAVQALIPMASRFLDQIGPMVQRGMAVLTGYLLDGLAIAGRLLWRAVGAILEALPGILTGAGRLLLRVVDLLQHAVIGILEGIRDWFIHRFPTAAGPIRMVFGILRAVVLAIMDSVRLMVRVVIAVLRGAAEFIGYVFAHIQEIATDAWNVIRDVTMAVVNVIVSLFEGAATVFRTVWNAVSAYYTALWNGVRDGVMYIWNVITGLITSPMATIQRVWNDLTGFFSGIFTSIRQTISADIEAAVGVVMHAVDRIRGAFNSVMDTVHSLFGHSVNTVVGADMERTVGVVRDATTAIQAELEHALFDAVVRALVGAFRSAMQQITQFTARFVTSQTDAYARMVHQIGDMWTRMWRDMLTVTDSAVVEMERRLARAMVQLQSAVANARATTTAIMATAQTTGPAAAMPERRLTNAATMDDLVRATDHPLWWTEQNGGVALLSAIVGQLTALNGAIVQALAAARGGPGGGAGRPGGAGGRAGQSASLGMPRAPVQPNLNPGAR